MNKSIYNELKRRIIFLEYEPGIILDEKRISAEFQTSRTPIREVLLILNWEKFIDIIPRGSIKVADIDFQRLKDLYFMRVNIESIAGKLSALYATKNHIENIINLKSAIEKSQNDFTPERLVNWDIQFRDILYDATYNSVLKEISDHLYYQTIRMWILFFGKNNSFKSLKNEYDHLLHEINETIEIIDNRDESKGESFRKSLMIRNIDLTKQFFLKDIA